MNYYLFITIYLHSELINLIIVHNENFWFGKKSYLPLYFGIKINIPCTPGVDPGFQVRGGALKKIAPSGVRRENFWGISCEKLHF